MKPIRFTARAERDMRSIIRYYENIAPGLSKPMVADIRQCIEKLRRYPRIGARIEIAGAHRVLSRRYRYKVTYRVTREAIEIVGVFRFQNRTL